MTSPPLDDAAIKRGVVPFYARLDPAFGGRSVRAIWSADFEQTYHALFQDDVAKRRHPEHSNRAPWLPDEGVRIDVSRTPWFKLVRGIKPMFRTSLDVRDRHELVLLSSVYGLPALLPMPTVDPERPAERPMRADASVMPLPEGFPVGKSTLVGSEGLYVPRPLSQVDLTLSALGANVNLEGQWEPPSGFFLDDAPAPIWPALTVERWRHQAFQGRDVFVEVVYKGFLFPFGHRCSIVKTTERTFYPDPRAPNDQSASVAYLTQRFYVLVGKKEKTFSAVGQPFEGRAMPFAAINMRTTKTPPILDPFDKTNRLDLQRALDIGAIAFYPRLSDGTKVKFDFDLTYADGRSSKKLTAPLIVVDNTLAHDPTAIADLLAYYNNLSGGEIVDRQADAYGQRIKYAVERDPGGTEFRTKLLTLGAHERGIAATDKQRILPFVMDAVMEGDDQPPFYPAIDFADVEIQSLNVMNGVTQGFTKVSHDLLYLRYGFAPGRNDAEIYLTIQRPNYLKLESRPNASGGIATPNNKVVAISRLKGPVGGTDSQPSTSDTLLRNSPFHVPVPDEGHASKANPLANLAAFFMAPFGAKSAAAQQSSLALTAVPPEPAPSPGDRVAHSYELPASHVNKFDPLEFFGKALSQAKLFGIIPLKDVVKAISFVDGAPETIERTTYSLFDLGKSLKGTVAAIAADISSAIAEARQEFRGKLKQFGDGLPAKPDLKPEDLYPALWMAAGSLQASIKNLAGAVDAYNPAKPNEAEVIEATSNAARDAQRLLAETRKVIQKPTPAVAQAAITDINNALRALKEGVAGAIAGYLTDQTVTAITTIPKLLIVDIQEDDELFPLAVMAFAGYPDTEYEILPDENKPTLPSSKPVVVKFDITNPEHRRRAQEALLYEAVGKPLIDAYMAIESLVAKIRAGAVESDAAFKELPAQIVSVAEQWINGLLKLEQYAAVARRIAADAGDLWGLAIEPILVNYVVPVTRPIISKAIDVRQQGEAANTAIAGLLDQLKAIIKKRPRPEIQARLEQAMAMIAKAQKALDAALIEYDRVGADVAKFVDAKAPAGDNAAYLRPLRETFNKSHTRALAQFNGLVGRLFHERDSLFRRARDAVAAAIETVDVLGQVDQALAGSPSSASSPAVARLHTVSDDVGDIRKGVADLLTALAKLVQNVGKFDPSHPFDAGTAKFSDKVSAIKNLKDEIEKKVSAIKGTVQPHYDEIVATAGALATELRKSNPNPKDLKGAFAALATSADNAIAYVFDDERVLAGLVAQGMSFSESTIKSVEKSLYDTVGPLLDTPVSLLLKLDTAVLETFETVIRAFPMPAPGATDFFELFLSKSFVDMLRDANHEIRARLKMEIDELAAIHDGLVGTGADQTSKRAQAERLTERLSAWRDPKTPPAILAVVQPLAQVLDILVNGKLADFIDVRQSKPRSKRRCFRSYQKKYRTPTTGARRSMRSPRTITRSSGLTRSGNATHRSTGAGLRNTIAG